MSNKTTSDYANFVIVLDLTGPVKQFDVNILSQYLEMAKYFNDKVDKFSRR